MVILVLVMFDIVSNGLMVMVELMISDSIVLLIIVILVFVMVLEMEMVLVVLVLVITTKLYTTPTTSYRRKTSFSPS